MSIRLRIILKITLRRTTAITSRLSDYDEPSKFIMTHDCIDRTFYDRTVHNAIWSAPVKALSHCVPLGTSACGDVRRHTSTSVDAAESNTFTVIRVFTIRISTRVDVRRRTYGTSVDMRSENAPLMPAPYYMP
jgi:hypothetical protein